MERIKQAIEKARHSTPLGNATTGLVPTRSSTSAASGISPKELEHIQAEVVTLDSAHLERHRIVAFNKTHPANWAFDVLRTKVLKKMVDNGWKTLAITSPTIESGKTVVAINLAASIAHLTEQTAMLVDFDLRRPRVAQYLGLSSQFSLNDVFENQSALSSACVRPQLPGLVVLPTARPVPKSSELLSSQKVASIIGELRDRYQDRIVIFDLPPVLTADDVIAVLPRIDCVLLVVGNGMSSQKDIEEAMRRMPESHLLGVVLNKDDSPVEHGYY